jgi:LDH2 family malate/lactate/ureidoglycolate dehydrogenase
MPTVRVSVLQTFTVRVLEAIGLPPDAATVTADCLVHANLRGVDSHGVMRLVQYSQSIARGDVNPRPAVEVLSRSGCTALIDAGGGYGFAPTLMAVELALELASEQGVGVVGVRNSHHFGMAATYSERAAAARMIGITTTNTGPVMAPIGGMKAVLGNNPIAFAIPRRLPQPPIVFDMALSATAFGKIRLAAAEGASIPIGWAFDTQGRPTTDAAQALEAVLLAPMGAHKGYGLALVLDVLTGILTGSRFGSNADGHLHAEGGVGHLIIVLDPGLFVPKEQFLDSVEALLEEVRSVPLAEGSTEIHIPGDIEYAVVARRERDGIPLSDEWFGRLIALGREFGVDTSDMNRQSSHANV